jgi:hypothetical protein
MNGETLMRYTSRAPDRRELSWPRVPATSELKSPARFGRRTVGFWLGGGLLGTAGCILGVCMPYQHPVAVAISVFWWGIYLGCFGASVGALIGVFTERAAASAPPPSAAAAGILCRFPEAGPIYSLRALAGPAAKGPQAACFDTVTPFN